MANARPDLRLGRIVWATIEDARGNSKDRPAVILTRTDEIRPDEPFQVAAITTSFPNPPPVDHVELPWHPRGNTSTRLRRRSAVVLSWIAEVHPRDIRHLEGDVPPRTVLAILDRLANMDAGNDE